MMDPLFFIKILYFLSLVSFNLVCCNLYSDPLASDKESCDAKDHGCNLENHHHDTEEDDGPTFVGRDGLTRLDGITVSCEFYCITADFPHTEMLGKFSVFSTYSYFRKGDCARTEQIIKWTIQ